MSHEQVWIAKVKCADVALASESTYPPYLNFTKRPRELQNLKETYESVIFKGRRSAALGIAMSSARS
jgi:hypothetical protein